jgi:hypothetical protein
MRSILLSQRQTLGISIVLCSSKKTSGNKKKYKEDVGGACLTVAHSVVR